MRLNYLLLIIISFFVYSNTISNGYNFDDDLVTMNNPSTSAESEVSIVDIFSSSYHEAYGYSYGYRPITTLSFYFEHRIFKESPVVSHTINLLLYITVVLLLYYLLLKLFKSTNPYILLFIALLFTVHSLHTEVVSSIKNRDEILALLFLEFAVFWSLRFIKTKRLMLLLLVGLSVLLSLLSKKSGASLILLVPILLHIRSQLLLFRFLLLASCFTLPVSLFLFNLDLYKGTVVFTVCFLVYILMYYLLAQKYFRAILQRKPWYFFIPIFFSLLFLALGIFFEEVILWTFATLGLLFYARYSLKISFLFIVVLSFVGYFIFENNWFLLLNLFGLSITLIIPSASSRNRIAAATLLLITILLFIEQKGDWIYGLIYLLPLIVFFTARLNRWIPTLISLLTLIISGVMFNVVFFHLGLTIGSVVLYYYMDKSGSKEILRRGLIVWTVLIAAVLGHSHYQRNGSLLQTIEQKENLVAQQLSIEKDELDEGRVLEYMENTLVAPHTFEQRIATGAVVLGEYFRLMIFPKELSFYYGYSKIETTDFADYKAWLSIFIYLALLFAMIYFYKAQPMISFGLLLYFVAILLFSNWPVLIAGMVGERLAFMASLGFCIAVGGVLNYIRPSFNIKKPKSIEFVAFGLLVLLSVRTIARNDLWESPSVLMQNDIGHLENSAQANYMLAMSIVGDVVENSNPSQASFNRLNSAVTYFEKAIEIYPYFFNYHFDLGRTHVLMENYSAAKSAFLEAHRLEPDAIITIDELVKTSFDLEQYKDVIQYGKRYLSQSKSSEVIYELVAYSAFLISDFELSKAIIEEGLMYHPNNQNLNGLLLDVNNEKQSNGN